jgi:hypothetical protein
MATNTVNIKVRFTIDVEMDVGNYYDTTSFGVLREQAIQEGKNKLRKTMGENEYKVVGEPKLVSTHMVS